MLPGVIFSGPSLPRASVESAGFDWRPPVRRGDVAALLADRPAAIGIVDGVFETEPTVWHDEILDALALGIPVYGASSIGALRAAELDSFGMIGVGTVYAAYRDGVIEDDDEVALLHAPAELQFRPLTVPMINIRAGVADALRRQVLPRMQAVEFLASCAATFYKQRTMERVGALACSVCGPLFEGPWHLDQKLVDAEQLVHHMVWETSSSRSIFVPRPLRPGKSVIMSALSRSNVEGERP